MRRLLPALAVFLGALLLVVTEPAWATTESAYYYLESDGWPQASLDTAEPGAGSLPDVDGDGKPGRTIDRSNLKLGEINKNKYQDFRVEADDLQLSGSSVLTIWTASKDMKEGKTNTFFAYLLACSGTCEATDELASVSKTLIPAEGTWTKVVLDLGSVDKTLGTSTDLVLRLMVDQSSDDSMMFAYGTSEYPSSVKVQKAEPPPSTTTTTSTTTSTTTTLPSDTTTTTAPTTTTTVTASTPTSSTTSSTLAPPSTTTTIETTTTTTDVTSSTSRASNESSSALPSTTTTTAPPSGELDIEKTGLVIKTTPAQRGIAIASDSVEMTPVEGLMVSFVTAAESVTNQLWSAVGLGLIMAALLVIGMSRRAEDSKPDA